MNAKIIPKSQNSLVQEVRQFYSTWVYQIIRLYGNSNGTADDAIDKPYIEFDWIVGPIPKEEKQTILLCIIANENRIFAKLKM